MSTVCLSGVEGDDETSVAVDACPSCGRSVALSSAGKFGYSLAEALLPEKGQSVISNPLSPSLLLFHLSGLTS